MARLKFLLTVTLFILISQLRAQLPVCSATNRVIYYQDFFSDKIYNLDLSQATPVPVLNTITSPPEGLGLVVSNNLNAAAPATTFYTIVNGKYFYYNGTSWVNTNHNAGPGVNAGGGGGFIYNYDGQSIWRYDGRGDATFLINTLPFGTVADIAVDCSGNFYILHNNIPQTLTKYNSSGTVLNIYTVTGAPVISGGGGIVIFGNDVYYDDISAGNAITPLLHGIINGTAINFTATGITINKAGDMAACSGGVINSAPVNETICSNQLPFNWNGQNYSTTGTYSVTLTGSNGCDSIATLNLVVNAVVTNTVDTSICSSLLPFAWNGQNYSLPGIYLATLTTTGGCDSIVILHLTITPSPVIAFAGNDDIAVSDVPYQLSGSGGLQYEWTPGRPLLNDPDIANPVAILNNTTTFSLIVKDAIGCKGYDTVKITVIKGTDIAVPSAFTPNRDGYNDILRPLGTEIERLDYFRIYNRYGELLFETHDISKGWDGTYKGKDQNMGNYMWVLKALDRKKTIRTMRGSVVLIR